MIRRALEILSEARDGVRLLLTHPLPSRLQRCQLALLKLVATAGYTSGKHFGFHSNHGKRGAAAEVKPHFDQAFTTHIAARAMPRVGILIPVFAGDLAEVERLHSAIVKLQRQTRPPAAIIVVNDASPHKLKVVSAPVQVLMETLSTNSGPGEARNVGFKIARSLGLDLLCCTDSDCLPAYNWVECMVNAQAEQPGIVYGNTSSHEPSSLTGLFHDITGTLNGRLLPSGEVVYGTTCNLSISLPHVNLEFDSDFTIASFEDLEWCFRAKELGIPVRYEPKAAVQHCFRPGAKGIFRQFQRYGAFEDLMIAKHPNFGPLIRKSTHIPAICRPDQTGPMHVAKHAMKDRKQARILSNVAVGATGQHLGLQKSASLVRYI